MFVFGTCLRFSFFVLTHSTLTHFSILFCIEFVWIIWLNFGYIHAGEKPESIEVVHGMYLLFLDGLGGGVGGRFLSSLAMVEEVILKFLVSTYSYVEFTILVVVEHDFVRVIVPFGLMAPPSENELVFQSRL